MKLCEETNRTVLSGNPKPSQYNWYRPRANWNVTDISKAADLQFIEDGDSEFSSFSSYFMPPEVSEDWQLEGGISNSTSHSVERNDMEMSELGETKSDKVVEGLYNRADSEEQNSMVTSNQNYNWLNNYPEGDLIQALSGVQQPVCNATTENDISSDLLVENVIAQYNVDFALMNAIEVNNGHDTGTQPMGMILDSKPANEAAHIDMDILNEEHFTKLGRFQVNPIISPQLEITLEESLIQCLEVVINYNGYMGTLTAPVKPEYAALTNRASFRHDYRYLTNKPTEAIEPNEDGFHEISGALQRVRYTRDISELHGTVSNIEYFESRVYDVTNPYEPQYYRFEQDENGNKINGSKCGLCPYCQEVKFLPFKNSSYLSHLTLEHGIFSNNYLIPDGLYYGIYLTSKTSSTPQTDDFISRGSSPTPSPPQRGRKNHHKLRHAKAIQCPACFQVIEVCCWSMKVNPLLSYFRHFKKHHSDLTVNKNNHKEYFNTNNIVKITKRGRTLKTK